MRVWHKELIPKLCKNHLLAMWREGLGLYKILKKGEGGYYNHPQTKMYHGARHAQWEILKKTREEMLSRDWNPKELPPEPQEDGEPNEWQSLQEQIKILKDKNCNCKIQ